MLHRHGPILRTACAASVAFAVLASMRFDELRLTVTPVLAAWFVAGLLYTNLFEYCLHRFPMHRGLPLLRHVRRNHIEHHRIFHGENFRTVNSSDLAHISGRFWIFPVLLTGHYALLAAVAPIDAALAFLCACYLHYLAFEISHWLTHVANNAVDRMLSGIPVVGALRARQIEHHRVHHETPTGAFNFNPPYLGDALLRTSAARAPRRPVIAVPARRRLPARPAVLYGTALILGAVALGIAAIAQVRPAPGAPAPRSRS